MLFLATSIGAFAADEASKKTKKAPASLAARIIKKYEAVSLTEDQTSKIKELASAAEKQIGDLKTAAALTDAQKEAQKTAMKAAKDAGKEKKDLREAVNAAVKLSDAQVAAQEKMRTVTREFNKAVQALLTDDQKNQAQSCWPSEKEVGKDKGELRNFVQHQSKTRASLRFSGARFFVPCARFAGISPIRGE